MVKADPESKIRKTNKKKKHAKSKKNIRGFLRHWLTKVGMAVDGVSKEKKKKKKLKVEDVQDAGDTNVMVCHDVSVQTVVKKEEPLDTNIRDGEKWERDAGEKKKKKKKKLKEETEADSSVCCDASVQTAVKTEHSDINIGDAPEKTKKKKKKKIKQEAEQIQEDGEHLVSKKKKAKKQGYEDEVEGIEKKKKKKEVEVKEEEADLGHSVEVVKKKKKKRKTDDDVAEQEQNTELVDGEIKKKRKKQKEADECEEEEQKVKKKKKKKSSGEEEPDETEEKSKKLKKKLQSVDEGESHPHANGGRKSSSDKKMKKRIKTVADDVTEIEEEPVGKKKSKDDRKKTPEKAKIKKLKQEHYEAMVETESKTTDIVFLSEKPGNQDEVSIDQARRLALQRDIDKESQPKPTLGQWGTAQFDSTDRQAKFLRLMGGFKKSSQPLTGSAGRANMALGKEGQQTLQQGLLGEFERAQNRHMDFRNKGAGLGFAAPSNKKFAIDVNARNSVRFDD